MVRVLIIFCHPARNSYTHEILAELKDQLTKKKIAFDVSDLYAIAFPSDLTESEYNRESSSRNDLPVADDVLKEHQKIKNAECIIFLYPVWWSDCPAKLKGWFDRVFTVGFAYKYADGIQRMDKKKYGVAMCTAGYTNDHLKDIGIAQSMEHVMVQDRMGSRFDYKEMIILGGTLDVDKVRQEHITTIATMVNKIEKFSGTDLS